jgi:hypothetical protein
MTGESGGDRDWDASADRRAFLISTRDWSLAMRVVHPLVALLLLATYWAVRSWLDAGIVDDAYINLRYVQHLVHGQGPVYNLDERVEGYTSPAWLLCLTLVAVLPGDLVRTATGLGGIVGAAAILLVWWASRRQLAPKRPWLGLFPAGFLATNPSFVYWTWSGMETALVALLLLASVLLTLRASHDQERPYAAGLVFALATFTRLDLLVLLPVFLLFVAGARRRCPRHLLGHVGAFLLPQLLLGIHVLWRHHYYGAWLPNTFAAKAALPWPALLSHGLVYTADCARAYHLPLAAVGLVLLSLLRPPITWAAVWVFPLTLLAVWAGYVTAVGGDHLAMFRFYAPVLPLLALLVTRVLAWLLDQPAIGWEQRPRWVVVGCVLTLTFALASLNVSIYRDYDGARARGEVALARAWASAGGWLRAEAPANTTLAGVTAGALPYYAGLRSYDLVGLTDRTVATQGKVYAPAHVGHQKYHTDYILARQPDYIIFLSPMFTTPSYHGPASIDKEYAYSLYDLLTDPRTLAAYHYCAVRLADGRYLEFFQRGDSASGTRPTCLGSTDAPPPR